MTKQSNVIMTELRPLKSLDTEHDTESTKSSLAFTTPIWSLVKTAMLMIPENLSTRTSLHRRLNEATRRQSTTTNGDPWMNRPYSGQQTISRIVYLNEQMNVSNDTAHIYHRFIDF